MTKILFLIIDNHKNQKVTKHNVIYKTYSFKEFERYVREKGID